MSTITQESFLKDVAEHQMTVLHEDGVYRHVRFAKPGTSCMSFNLVTYPGHLVYSGDMGNFVFERLRDMFEFFRTDREHGVGINPGYWSEKVEAADTRCGGVEKWSMDLFCDAVKRDFDQHWADTEDTEARDECWQEVEDRVLNASDEWEAVEAVRGFEHEGFEFTDFWEHRLKAYTHRFLWCCFAVAWGIQQYDAAKAAQQPTAIEAA